MMRPKNRIVCGRTYETHIPGYRRSIHQRDSASPTMKPVVNVQEGLRKSREPLELCYREQGRDKTFVEGEFFVLVADEPCNVLEQKPAYLGRITGKTACITIFR